MPLRIGGQIILVDGITLSEDAVAELSSRATAAIAATPKTIWQRAMRGYFVLVVLAAVAANVLLKQWFALKGPLFTILFIVLGILVLVVPAFLILSRSAQRRLAAVFRQECRDAGIDVCLGCGLYLGELSTLVHTCRRCGAPRLPVTAGKPLQGGFAVSAVSAAMRPKAARATDDELSVPELADIPMPERPIIVARARTAARWDRRVWAATLAIPLFTCAPGMVVMGLVLSWLPEPRGPLGSLVLLPFAGLWIFLNSRLHRRALRRHIRRERALNRCHCCLYDLHGSPEAARQCPECGARILPPLPDVAPSQRMK